VTAVYSCVVALGLNADGKYVSHAILPTVYAYGCVIRASSMDELKRTVELNKLYKKCRSYRKFKLHLVKDIGRCFWCKKKVVDYVPPIGESQKHDTATIDHTVSRFVRKKGDVVLKVLACYYCNQKRAREEERKYVKLKR
jgi:hypothetical protein